MVVITVANPQLGVSCIEGNGILASNYSQRMYLSSGFRIYRRPIVGVASETKNLKQQPVFSSRTRDESSALVRSESGMVEGGIIEKEIEFKPSFEEYLKAMESVKSVREKNQSHPSTMSKSRIDSRGKGAPTTPSLKGDDEKGKLGKFEEQICAEKSKSSKQGVSYKNSVRGEISCTDRGKRRLKDAGKTGFGERGNRGSAHGLAQNKFDPKEREMVARVKRKLEINTARVQGSGSNGKYEGQSFEINRWPVVSSVTSGRSVMDHLVEGKKVPDIEKMANDVKLSRRSKPNLEYGSDDNLETERAAFNSLDKFNDVYDKPRVSRVDMDERIQRLAKCLNGADIDMPEWIFSKMMRSAKIRFADHSMLRLIQILGKFGNWRRVLQVIEWIQLRECFKSQKIRYIYTAALDALGKARRPVEALNVFHAMQQHMTTYPDLVAYHSIAVTLGQAGHMKELFDVIDSMRSPPKKKLSTGVLQKWDPRLEPDIVVYNAVLNACMHRKKWEGAFWVLQQLKQQDQQPSSATYGLVMEVMFACGKYDLVLEFFRKAQKSSIPNALTYKVLVNTFWRQGNINEAMLAVRDMERRGIIGSSGLYYDLARCLCSAGRCQDALMQIDKICKVANKPLVVTYTGLIQACLDSRNIQSGIYIFNHMQKFCSPNLVTCNIMLKGYLDYDMFEDAKQLFQKLLENVYHVRSKLDYNDRVIPDIHTFNLMLDACVAKHQWNDLECVYTRMLQHGYHFNVKRHLRMIVDACRAGKVELLETTWKHFVQEDQLPPPLLIREMFRLKLEQNDYAAAFSYIAYIPLSESHRFSPKSWLNFFRENGHHFRKDTLVRLVDEVNILIAQSDSQNLIFQHLMSSCKELLST